MNPRRIGKGSLFYPPSVTGPITRFWADSEAIRKSLSVRKLDIVSTFGFNTHKMTSFRCLFLPVSVRLAILATQNETDSR